MQEPFVIRAHDARLVSAGMPSRDLLQYVRYGRRRETAGTQRAGHGPTMVSHVMSAVLVADCGDAAVSSASPGAPAQRQARLHGEAFVFHGARRVGRGRAVRQAPRR